MSRLNDEWSCPKCGSQVVYEHRGDENQLLHVGTACGADWYSDFCDDRPEGHLLGWNHRSHACSLILGLMAEKVGAEHDRDAIREQLIETQAAYTAAVVEVERAVRMLVGYGMNEHAARAALDVKEPSDG
jgi:hypothetical protein